MIFAPGRLELRYLFCAKLYDGTIIEQTLEDCSQFVEGKNAYYDLLSCDDCGVPLIQNGKVYARSDVELFQMENESCRYLVDLTDGHFETQFFDGTITAHFFVNIPPKDKQLRPFWFLRRRQHMTDGKLSGQECEYHFGWETNDGIERAELILI